MISSDPPRTLSPATVCALLGVTKSTLFRWERDEDFPRVPRDIDGQRQYGREHLEAICAKQLEQIHRYYDRAAADGDRDALKELERALSFVKVVSGDEPGIRRFAHQAWNADDVRRFVEAAIALYEPTDREFQLILETALDWCWLQAETAT